VATRFPKPWFRPKRGIWYVTLDGQQISLGSDREEAFRRYHKLMDEGRPKSVASDKLLAVIDTFLDWCQKNRAADTYRWYLDRLQRFAEAIPPDLRCSHLRPYHVQEWVDAMSGIANGTKRNYIRSVQRAMRWAEQQGRIERSPIAHMEKPVGGKREVVITQAEFDALLSATRMREFRDLLIVSWETGCRPQESLRVEARHVDVQLARWVFPASEAKSKNQPRIVYLTESALEITQRLMLAHPAGPLFRNSHGCSWSADAVNCRFDTLAKKLGKKYCLYHLRHTWMNRMLTSGVDALTVAVLAGHSDPSTLAKTYQHLSQNPEYLQRQARSARVQ
jgi:integrase